VQRTVQTTRTNRFEGLFREHYPAVRAYASRRAPYELAQDVIAETFLIAWRRFDDLPSDPLPWLYGVARRVLANQRRSAGRGAALEKKLAFAGSDGTARPGRPGPWRRRAGPGRRGCLAGPHHRRSCGGARRARHRVPRLLALGAATAAVGLTLFLALDLFDSGTPGPDVVQKALAAVSSKNAIYHLVVFEDQSSTPEDPAIKDPNLRWRGRFFSESWFGPGYRLHTRSFRYDHGRRGRATSEIAGRSGICRERRCRMIGKGLQYDRRRNVARAIGIGPVAQSGPIGPASVTVNPFADPSARLRQALERHLLRVAGTTEVAGRTAYRLVSKVSRQGPAIFHVRAHIEYLVDAESYLPLEER
jgi:Sigma-70 region 2